MVGGQVSSGQPVIPQPRHLRRCHRPPQKFHKYKKASKFDGLSGCGVVIACSSYRCHLTPHLTPHTLDRSTMTPQWPSRRQKIQRIASKTTGGSKAMASKPVEGSCKRSAPEEPAPERHGAGADIEDGKRPKIDTEGARMGILCSGRGLDIQRMQPSICPAAGACQPHAMHAHISQHAGACARPSCHLGNAVTAWIWPAGEVIPRIGCNRKREACHGVLQPL